MNRLLLLLLFACQTIICSGCSDRQPPPKPQTTIETDTQASSDTAENPSSDTAENPSSDTSENPSSDTSENPSSDTSEKRGLRLSEYTTSDFLYLEMEAGKSDEWELKRITLIAEVHLNDGESVGLKSDNFNLIIGIIEYPEQGLRDPQASSPLAKYSEGETYLFSLVIENIDKMKGTWIIMCLLADEVLEEEIFTFMNEDVLEIIFDDLAKMKTSAGAIDWNFCFSAKVKRLKDDSVTLATNLGFIFVISWEEGLTIKYQFGEEYLFFVNRLEIFDNLDSGYKGIGGILIPDPKLINLGLTIKR